MESSKFRRCKAWNSDCQLKTKQPRLFAPTLITRYEIIYYNFYGSNETAVIKEIKIGNKSEAYTEFLFISENTGKAIGLDGKGRVSKHISVITNPFSSHRLVLFIFHRCSHKVSIFHYDSNKLIFRCTSSRPFLSQH